MKTSCGSVVLRMLAAALVAVALLVPASAAWAVDYQLQTTLTPPSTDTSTSFGSALTMVGDKVLILGSTDAEGMGTAYLFDATTGDIVRTFYGTPGTGNGFGGGTAAFGENVLIAASEDGSRVVYLFDSSTGALLRTFHDPDAATDYTFGAAVTSIGDAVLIGAPYTLDETYTGKAYLFDGSTGELLRTLESPDSDSTYFGLTVAARGADLVIASTLTVYLFDGSTGDLLLTIPRPNDYSGPFGELAVVGDDVLAGMPGATPGDHFYTGQAYLFDGDTGAVLRTFESSYPLPHQYFGISVAAVDGNALAGAPFGIVQGPDGDLTGAPGRADLYDAVTGELLYTFQAPAPAYNDWFGSAVAAAGDNVVISAPPAVYVFAPIPHDVAITRFQAPRQAAADHHSAKLRVTVTNLTETEEVVVIRLLRENVEVPGTSQTVTLPAFGKVRLPFSYLFTAADRPDVTLSVVAELPGDTAPGNNRADHTTSVR